MDDKLKQYFPNNQGWHLFKAACQIADDARAEVAKLRGKTAAAESLAEASVQSAIAKSMGKATPSASTADLTTRIRKNREVRLHGDDSVDIR